MSDDVSDTGSVPELKRMRLRRPGVCATCAEGVEAGQLAGWHRARKVVLCLNCLEPQATSLPENLPGASLQREYERRTRRREERVRERFPRIGGLLLAIAGEEQSTKAFRTGAEGERAVAQYLEKVTRGEVLFLHNRRRGVTAGSGDIDHIAVAPRGVFIIDPKNYKDARVRVRRTGGLVRPVREQLIVNGRDRTGLLASLEKQRAAVTEALGREDIPVLAMLCFVGADLPLVGESRVNGFPVVSRRGAGRMLMQPGQLGPERRREIRDRLARALPPA